jgi:hypothetical protein
VSSRENRRASVVYDRAMSRQMRSLVPAEVACVLAAAVAPLPVSPVVVLLVAASISRWLRGQRWTSVVGGPGLYAAIGAAVGLVALGLALAVTTPALEAITEDAVQWSTYPVVRGSPGTAVTVAIVVAIGAVAAELALRGWLVERVLELGGHPVLAILAGALAEAAVTGGGLAMRIGAGLFGLALGWLYVAGGRSALASVCARLVFSLGALALETLRLVG